MRINASLDQEYINKLEALKHQEHLSTTEIIKNALAYYYEMKNQNNNTKIQQLLNSDFIACGEAPEDLSEHYKEYLSDSMSNKYDPD